MKNVLFRGILAGATIGSALLIVLAGPAAADENCALGVVCTGGPVVDTAPPAQPSDPPPSQSQPQQQPQPAAQPDHRSGAEITADLLRMLNQERSSRGLPLFTRHADVDEVAAGWSDHLAEEGRLSHNDAYFTEQSRRAHGGKALGENVAMDAEAQPAHEHLMASPHHRDNILDARFTVVGLGATYRNGSWWITEDFLQPSGAPAAGREIARSMPAPPARTPAAPTNATVPVRAVTPSAEVDTTTEEAHGPHWSVTAPGFLAEQAGPLSLESSSSRRIPAPATGLAVAGLCCVAGLYVRRRAAAVAATS